MYKAEKAQQLTFDGFNQSCGMKLNPKDEWVILADMIDWKSVEVAYSAHFKSKRGRPAVSARQALKLNLSALVKNAKLTRRLACLTVKKHSSSTSFCSKFLGAKPNSFQNCWEKRFHIKHLLGNSKTHLFLFLINGSRYENRCHQLQSQ